ncbi:hypothetical protein BFS13_10585 [Pantoea sp. Ae16]|nr:hypothetical protein BFS13_10585 [Pantoea sp. Ae16]
MNSLPDSLRLVPVIQQADVQLTVKKPHKQDDTAADPRMMQAALRQQIRHAGIGKPLCIGIRSDDIDPFKCVHRGRNRQV